MQIVPACTSRQSPSLLCELSFHETRNHQFYQSINYTASPPNLQGLNLSLTPVTSLSAIITKYLTQPEYWSRHSKTRARIPEVAYPPKNYNIAETQKTCYFGSTGSSGKHRDIHILGPAQLQYIMKPDEIVGFIDDATNEIVVGCVKGGLKA